MNADEYQEYLHTEHWHETRQRALRAVGWRCEACTSTHKLHVHHRDYARLGNEHPDDLRVLCDNCHHLVHESASQQRIRLAAATDLITSIRPIDPTEPRHIGDVAGTMIDLLAIRSENAALEASRARHPATHGVDTSPTEPSVRQR
jgi:hypothetical protein